MAASALAHTFRRLRRRMVWVTGASGLLWGATAFLAVIVAAVWVDLVLDLPAGLRAGAWAASGVALLVLSAAVIWRGLRRTGASDLAARLDDVAATGGQIRSGTDLSGTVDRAAAYSARPDLTAALAEIAVDRAASLAAAVPPRAAVPARPLLRSLAVLTGVAALIGLLVLSLPRIAFTQWLRFSRPFADHPAWSPYIFHVTPEGAEIVYGSSLDLRVTVEGPPLDRLELVLSSPGVPSAAAADVLPMFPESDGGWRASIANITQPLNYYVRTGRARSNAYSVRVITVPVIESVWFRVTPPAYTGDAEYRGPLPPGGLSGLPGTRVEVVARSNRPLSAGRMDVVAGDQREEITLQPVGDQSPEVRGEFTIRASGRLDLRVVDVEGQPSVEAFTAPVVLLADEHPFVRLLQPRAVSFATPTAFVPVVISGEDDYGLSRCQLFRSLNDSRYLPLEVAVAPPPPRRLHEVMMLPLAAYGLQPGDEIKLFARVEDNDPGAAETGGAGKGAESTVAVIRIIAQEEFDRLQRTRNGLELLTSKYQQAQRRMESLAEQIEKLLEQLKSEPADSPVSEELRKELERLTQQLKEESEALEKLSQNLLPYELDKELTKQLQQLAQQLAQLAKQSAQMAADPQLTNPEAAEQLQQMRDQLQQQREQFDQNAMQPLELLQMILPIKQAEARFIQIYQRQRDLADRLASLRGRDNEDDPALKARMRDLEEEQRQLRNQLAEFTNELAERALQLPEDPRLDELRQSVGDFIDALEASGASDAMTEAETGLAEFSGTRGHTGALRAADILESLIEKSQGMGQQGQGALPRFQPSLGGALGQTMQQLLADMGLAGMGQQNGMGQGAGGGFSMTRSTADNVGLYGGNPLMEQAGMTERENNTDQSAAGGVLAPSSSGNGRNEGYATRRTGQATGGSDAAIPLRYRQKVARYLDRLADEIGDE